MSHYCEVVLPELGAFIDGELEPRAELFIERHLAECHRCRAELAAERMVKEQVGRIARESAPNTLRERVFNQLRADVSRERVWVESVFIQESLTVEFFEE